MKVLQILTIIALFAVLDLQFVVVECVAQRESAPTTQVVQPDAATVASVLLLYYISHLQSEISSRY